MNEPIKIEAREISGATVRACNSLNIADTAIRQDAEGRYCLNDLHRAAVASGANERTKEPGKFFASQQTADLVKELSDTQDLGITPVNVVKGNFASGIAQGTYVVKELVYAYAMWISPAFHLKVIRAYDAMVTAPPVLNPANLSRLQLIELAFTGLRGFSRRSGGMMG